MSKQRAGAGPMTREAAPVEQGLKIDAAIPHAGLLELTPLGAKYFQLKRVIICKLHQNVLCEKCLRQALNELESGRAERPVERLPQKKGGGRK